MYLQQRGTSVTLVTSKRVSEYIDSSRVVTPVEFGQEVSWTRLLSLVEIAHYVGLLLPDVDGLLEFHFPLRMSEHTGDCKRSLI